MPVSLVALTAGAVSVDATSLVNFFLMPPNFASSDRGTYTLCDCRGSLRTFVLYCAATKT
jgi:hypothetical protein